MQNESSQNRSDKAGFNRHLELAVQHCSQAWFPVNPSVLKQIQESLGKGVYESSKHRLLQDLKQDFALFTYVTKKIIGRKRAFGAQDPAGGTPANLFRDSSAEDLSEILNVEPDQISSHRMNEITELQTLRLKQTMMSASVAELMAEKATIDPETGFSCGVFRQLGLTLIAWNYPHVYKRALTTLKPNDKVDAVLSKILGFSPTNLGLAIARTWGLSDEIRAGMGDKLVPHTPELKSVGETLDKICRVGEALARASDPEHYPTAKHDWNEAKVAIEAALGSDGMDILRLKLDQYCLAYIRVAPELFQFPGDLNQDKDHSAKNPRSPQAAAPQKKRSIIKNNTYIKHCPEDIQQELTSLYEQLDGVTISKGSVDTLTKRVIPLAGFIHGCVYLIEPDTLSLVPRLIIGGEDSRQFRAVNYKSTSSEFDPIVAAFKCQHPIMEDGVVVDDKLVSYVAGALGEMQKAGVLYLEISDDLLKSRNQSALLVFKALRQALADCLNLR